MRFSIFIFKSKYSKQKIVYIEPEFIVNMDETTLNYNMPPNTTVYKIGAKTIFIKTQREEINILKVKLN